MRFCSANIDRIHIDTFLRDEHFRMSEYHFHPYYELYYLAQGQCSFFAGQTLYKLEPRSFILIPPGSIHYTRYDAGALTRRIAVFFRKEELAEPGLAELLQAEERFAGPCLFQLPGSYAPKAEGILSEMLAEERLMDAASPMLLSLRLRELLLFCHRVCSYTDQIPESIHTSDRQIIAAASFICKNYAEKLTLSQIAAVSGFSPNYFSRKFREAAGLGVHEYLSFIRLRHAALELLNTRHSITEVALNNGFSDPNYFKDVCKKTLGMSPREYRKAGGLLS